jgi:pyruvyl transferase EpsO
MLSQGKVIVTDRLHAHILSLLLGIPHIVFDDQEEQCGKVRVFYETWTKGCDLTRWVDSPAEAQRVSAVSG